MARRCVASLQRLTITSAPTTDDWPTRDLVAEVDTLLLGLTPNLVFSHWEGDSHDDHRRVAQAVLSASRLASFDLYCVPPSEHRTPAFDAFPANVFIDISEVEGLKEDAIRQYDYRGGPLRSFGLDALARRWAADGASVGIPTVERLLLVRQSGIPTGLVGTTPVRWHPR